MAKTWEELVPKIYKMAELENNPKINFLEDTESSTEGSLGVKHFDCVFKVPTARCVGALIMTYYMLPDTRAKSDHQKIIYFAEV